MDAITALVNSIIQYGGAMGIFAVFLLFVIAGLGYLIFVLIKQKQAFSDTSNEKTIKLDELYKAGQERVDLIHKEYGDKIEIMRKEHLATIKELSDKRIEDFREVSQDYDTIAKSTVDTLNRLNIQLELRNRKIGDL